MCRLLNKAQDWLAKAHGLAHARVPLKRMREIAHAGMRLPVNLPQVELLKGDIRWREWQDAATKVTPASPTLLPARPCHHNAQFGLLGRQLGCVSVILSASSIDINHLP